MEETLLVGVVNESAFIDFFFPFCLHDNLTRSTIYWACAGKTNTWHIACVIHFIHIFTTDVHVSVKLSLWPSIS